MGNNLFNGGNDEKSNISQNTRIKSEKYAKKNNKTILFVGSTGSGKTATMDNMMNYLYNGKLNGCRYYLSQEATNSELNETTEVNVYHIYPPKLNYGLTIIDTPGFGNYKCGYRYNNEIRLKIEACFKTQINAIDAIYFVVKSDHNRITPGLMYDWDEVLSIFGSNIQDNIFVVCTFGDGEKPKVLQGVNLCNVEYKKHYSVNNSVVNNRLGTDDSAKDFVKTFFEMNMQNYHKLFQDLGNTKKQSLAPSIAVLQLKKQLHEYGVSMMSANDIGAVSTDDVRRCVERLTKISFRVHSGIRHDYFLRLIENVKQYKLDDWELDVSYLTSRLYINKAFKETQKHILNDNL
eukprot:5799_1